MKHLGILPDQFQFSIFTNDAVRKNRTEFANIQRNHHVQNGFTRLDIRYVAGNQHHILLIDLGMNGNLGVLASSRLIDLFGQALIDCRIANIAKAVRLAVKAQEHKGNPLSVIIE